MLPAISFYHSVPITPAAMVDIWRVGTMVVELWSTSLETIAMRQRLWHTHSPVSPRLLRENQRMISEKLEASLEVGSELQRAMLGAVNGQPSPWWVTGRRTLGPLHRRTTANSQRLSQHQ